MDTKGGTTRNKSKRMRATTAILIALALALTPLLYQTPTALGGEGATAHVNIVAPNVQMLANGQVVSTGTHAVEAGRDLNLQITPDVGYGVVGVSAEDGTGAAAPCIASGASYLITQDHVADGLTIKVSTTDLAAGLEGMDADNATKPGGLSPQGEDGKGDGTASPQQGIPSEEGVSAASGFRLLAAAPENLFTINGSGMITYFAYNSSDPIKNLEIPSTIGGTTVTGIGNNVFAGCQLESVVIPATVKTLGTNAFASNPLTSVTYSGGPSQMTTIGESSFQGCSKLTSAGFAIPSTVTSIGVAAFKECVLLDSVVIPSGVTSLSYAFLSCTSLSSVTLPEGFTDLGRTTFQGCTSLASISLPSTLRSIGYNAFYSSGLQSITIPAGVQTIDSGAFGQVVRNIKIYLPGHYPDAITGKPWGAATEYIYWKSDNTSCFDIRSDGVIVGLKPAGHDGGACGHLDWHQQNGTGNIVIPKMVGAVEATGLLPNAFSGCLSIKTVTFEEGCNITEISPYAFGGCSKMTGITLPSTITSIGSGAFSNTNLGSITIPASVNMIGGGAFFPQSTLKTVTIQGSNPSLTIGNDAFPATENLKDVYLSGHAYASVLGQPWKGQYATIHWADKDYDPEIIITPDGWHYNRVTELLVKYGGPTGPSVDVTVPKSIAYGGNTYVVQEPLPGTLLGSSKTFRKITVSEGFTILSGNFASTSIVEEVVLPTSLKIIGNDAFRASKVKKINLPEGLDTIDRTAFVGCTNLVQIDNFLPSTLKTINTDAFKDVPLNMANMQLPNGIASIGAGVFDNCGLTGEMRIPNSIGYLYGTAFANNPGITALYVDQFRASCPFKNFQPWGASNAAVFYKGEVPLLDVEEASDASLADTPLSKVSLSTHLEKDGSGNTVPGFKLEGIWICEGDVATFPVGATRVYNAAIDGAKTEVADLGLALPNGTYTFWVSTNMMTKNAGTEVDPSQYRRCTIAVDKSLALDVSADDFTVKTGECASMTEAIALAKANAESHEPCYGALGANRIVAADIIKIKALSGQGSSTTVTVAGTYSGNYTYTGALLHPMGTVYPYTCTGSTEAVVTLWDSFTVTFEEGAHGTIVGGSEGRVEHSGFAFNAAMPASPAVMADTGYMFAGWMNKATGVVYDTGNPLPATVTEDANYEAQYRPLARTLAIEASGFSMSLAEAQAHQAATANARFQELLDRGQAHAFWKETGEPVSIWLITVAPSQGDGTSVDAIVGAYNVTYYAESNGQEVNVTVPCTVYGIVSERGSIAGNDFSYNIAGGTLSEVQVRTMGGITVYDAAGNPTGELGRINQVDLSALNQRIANGQLGPFPVRFVNAAGDEVTITVTLTSGGGGGGPIVAIVTPVAQFMQNIASTATGQPTIIEDDGTPLADQGWCWVHFYIIFFGLLTIAYTVAVVLRRNRFSHGLDDFENQVLGGPPAPGTDTSQAYRRAGQGTHI